jgi:protein gp37
MDRRYKKVQWGPGKPRKRTKTWNDPLRWNKEAERTGERPRVFCASLADWLDEEVDVQWREDLFDLIERCKNIDWLMLTKRPQNAKAFLPPDWLSNPRPWVWFGVTAENQKYWDIRVQMLAEIPACLRWVSYEPSIGPLTHLDSAIVNAKVVNWLIIGGESAQSEPARPFHLEWAESAIEQCREYDVVPFMKQTGSNAYYGGKPFPVKDKAGADPAEWPETVRVREFPVSVAV